MAGRRRRHHDVDISTNVNYVILLDNVSSTFENNSRNVYKTKLAKTDILSKVRNFS